MPTDPSKIAPARATAMGRYRERGGARPRRRMLAGCGAAGAIAYPLGSTQRVIAVDGDGLYAGIVIVADASASPVGRASAVEATIVDLVAHEDVVLLATMNAQEAAGLFRLAASEELAVVESLATRRVVGLVTERHLLRRYAEELDKTQRNLSGEG